jgi:hypothetical protein
MALLGVDIFVFGVDQWVRCHGEFPNISAFAFGLGGTLWLTGAHRLFSCGGTE